MFWKSEPIRGFDFSVRVEVQIFFEEGVYGENFDAMIDRALFNLFKKLYTEFVRLPEVRRISSEVVGQSFTQNGPEFIFSRSIIVFRQEEE
jgi:hypothetical protein